MNLVLTAISLVLTYLVLELVVPFTLNHVPLTMYNALPPEIRILGQSSKNSVIPKNYIALVGDSYAQGQGDWLKKNIRENRFKGTNPDYFSGHVIFRQTGIDVITYGTGGAGSVKGLVTAPITQHQYINSLWPYKLAEPKKLLVYFYEGNDFTDNSLYYTNRFLFKGYDESYFFKGYEASLFYNLDYFDTYLRKEALERYPIYKNKSPFRHMILDSLLGIGWSNLKKEIMRGWGNLGRRFNSNSQTHTSDDSLQSFYIRDVSYQPLKLNSEKYNIAMVNGKRVTLPNYLQGPPVTLSPEQMKRSVYIFERSLLLMSRSFPNSEISIVYIPGPASIYSLIGPNISFEASGWAGEKGRLTDKETLLKKSLQSCKKIYDVVNRNGFHFLDTRLYFREQAKKNILHGPEDHQHLNRLGQVFLAELIIKHILNSPKNHPNKNCKK